MVASDKDAYSSQADRFVIFTLADVIFLVWANNIFRFGKHNLEVLLWKYLHMKLHFRQYTVCKIV